MKHLPSHGTKYEIQNAPIVFKTTNKFYAQHLLKTYRQKTFREDLTNNVILSKNIN